MADLQIMLAVLYVLNRFNHVKCRTYGTVADNGCVICFEEIQPR